MATPQSVPPPIAYESSLSVLKRNDRHKETRARRFLGPMPTSSAQLDTPRSPTRSRQPRPAVQVQSDDQTSESSDSSTSSDLSDEEGLRDVVKARAYQWFLKHGGKEEEWGAGTEHRIRKEMRRKWRDSEWGRLRRARRGSASAPATKWVGDSFVVGEFLGISLLDDRLSASSRIATAPSTVYQTATQDAAASTVGTFVTAPSVLSEARSAAERTTLSLPSAGLPTDNASALNAEEMTASPTDGLAGPSSLHPIATSSTTALIRPTGDAQEQEDSPTTPRPPLKASLLKLAQSDGNLIPLGRKGKGKKVHYAEPDEIVEETPAAPDEVLARTGTDVVATSAGAAEAAAPESKVKWGDVVMRDRMLVRVSYTNNDILGGFDEERSRTARGIEIEYQGEFMVVWRKDRIELYQDYDMRIKSWFMRHLHLAYMVPLHHARTTLSLYSFVDMTFCITCPPTPVDERGGWLHAARGGTNIFVFKLKSRSRAVDWFWNLWRQREGTLPSIVEIRCPVLDTVVRIDLPAADDWDAAYARFSRANVLAMCTRALRRTRDWDTLVERAIREGDCALALAWRSETKLDWVMEEEEGDLEGRKRSWAVLWGLAARNPGTPTNLEFRLSLHAPSHLHLKNGDKLIESVSIEGYVDRIRPNTQARQSVYLCTHDGYLFCSPSSKGHAPAPPGTPSLKRASADDGARLRTAETRRGARQILESEGATDMRNIVQVRRAFQVTARRKEEPPDGVGIATLNKKVKPWEEEETFWEEVERTGSDEEDQGGEEGLTATANAQAKSGLKMRRSFELVMKTGQVVRYEAYSRRLALEWITTLRELVVYWRKRHHIDAREEMELAQVGRPRVTPHMHAHADEGDQTPPEPPPDPNASAPGLGAFYSWCLLDGCRPILRSGRLYVRKGLRGVYKHILLVLIPGHVVQFAITPNAAFHRRRKSGGGNAINLADAYICSGTFAARSLPAGQFNPNARPVARRYQDGLETDDPEEDTLFVLWYHPVTLGEGLDDPSEPKDDRKAERAPKDSIPLLSTNKKMVVFRTRSKFERDLWCWALNAEIERVVRSRKEHELKIRSTGTLLRL